MAIIGNNSANFSKARDRRKTIEETAMRGKTIRAHLWVHKNLDMADHKIVADQLQEHREETWPCEDEHLEQLEQDAFVIIVPAVKNNLSDTISSYNTKTTQINNFRIM
jgi:hypothetical protein